MGAARDLIKVTGFSTDPVGREDLPEGFSVDATSAEAVAFRRYGLAGLETLQARVEDLEADVGRRLAGLSQNVGRLAVQGYSIPALTARLEAVEGFLDTLRVILPGEGQEEPSRDSGDELEFVTKLRAWVDSWTADARAARKARNHQAADVILGHVETLQWLIREHEERSG